MITFFDHNPIRGKHKWDKMSFDYWLGNKENDLYVNGQDD